MLAVAHGRRPFRAPSEHRRLRRPKRWTARGGRAAGLRGDSGGAGLAGRHPIRFWNCAPGIEARAATVPERYMIFNVGRFRAFESWFGPGQASFGSLPASTAVGAVGRQLVISCLAAPAPSRHVENPRQTPAYRYSPRYGPLHRRSRGPLRRPRRMATSICWWPAPRASWVRRPSTGVTRGTDTRDAPEHGSDHGTSRGARDADPETAVEWLDRFRSVRVHLLYGREVSRVAPLVESRFRQARHVEFYEADLCRRDLLIEI